MSDLPQSALCPYGELLDKRILGEFSPEDRARLDEHLAQGCASCSERWKEEQKLESILEGAMAPLTTEIERRKPIVLDRLKERLAREDELRRDRRRRRLGMNTVLFIIVIFGVTLLSAEYFAYAAMRKKLVRAQKDACGTELRAILAALHKYAEQRGTEAVPADRSGLVPALAQRRRDIDRPYYAVDSSRLDPQTGLLLDPWNHPYVYKRAAEQVRIYSVGVNGQDEDGLGDDIAVTLILSK